MPVYQAPDVVPDAWAPNRPGEIDGFQPAGPRLGSPGPDQGFALKIAKALAPELHLQTGEHLDDVIRGCLGVAIKRASLFSRAPVVHDVRIAYTVWGFLDEQPDAELVELRKRLFEGVRLVVHHYAESRVIADMVPESTLRRTPAEVTAAHGRDWRSLLDA